MGSPHRDAAQEVLENGLVDVGNKLLKQRPSSIDELLTLLEQAENLLFKVRQQPPKSTAKALLPLMTALIADELSLNTDANVQVAVASCINELTRISAPDFPYNDDHMKGIFGLFMVAFEKLSCESGRNYERALQILETVASVRSCLMMVDIGCDELISEMFQLFLKIIRSNHPPSVFTHMEMIMNLAIQESDEISFSLLSPLLASVKMKNKNVSPISWELGEKVLRNCATKLRRYLRKAVESMNLDIDDYAEVVTSICRDTSTTKNKVLKEVVLSDEEISKSESEDRTPTEKTASGNPSDEENSQELKNNNVTEMQQQEMDAGAARKRRGRKPNSLLKPEEGYDIAWISGCSDDFFEVALNGKNKEKGTSPRSSSSKELASSTEQRKGKKPYFLPKKASDCKKIGTSVSEDHSGKGGPFHKKGRPKKNEILRPKENIETVSNTGTDRKDELSLKSKQIRNEINSEKCKSEKVRGKKSKTTHVTKNYGAELVGAKIQVWWPMDKTFYPGTVESFDQLTRKHQIVYEDEAKETLNLHKERWELVKESPNLKKDANLPSPATELVKKKKKMGKRKGGSLEEQELGTSSSKRSKMKSHKHKKSGENSKSNIYGNEDYREDECRGKNVSSNNHWDGAKHAVKQEAETSMSDLEPNN